MHAMELIELERQNMEKMKFVLAVGAIGLFFYFLTPSADRNESGQIITEGTVDVFSIRIGDCFDDTEDNVQISNVGGIPCGFPHDNEIYAITIMPNSAFPGEDAIQSTAQDYCLSQFESFVGLAYEESVLDISYLYPTQDSWNQANDREIDCIVYDMAGEKLSDSMRGKGI